MAMTKRSEKDNKIENIIETEFELYSDKRTNWATNFQEDIEFRFGRQWTDEEKRVIEARGHAPVVVNVIHPAVEAAKALLTSNRPSFRTSPREDSDNKVAQVFNAMLEYVYDISEGDAQVRSIVDDYYVGGMGVALAYQDPSADMGKGEVKFKRVDPLDVYVDPNARDRNCDDARSIIISRQYTKDQAKMVQSYYSNAIENATGNFYSDRPSTGRSDTGGTELFFPDDITTLQEDEYIRGYDYYRKIKQREFRIFEHFSGDEKLLDKEAFDEYLAQEALVIGNSVFLSEEDKASAMAEYESLVNNYKETKIALDSDMNIKMAEVSAATSNRIDELGISLEEERISKATYDVEYEKAMLELEAAEGMIKDNYNSQLEQITPPDKPKPIDVRSLIDGGVIEVVAVDMDRIEQTVLMGDAVLYQRVLPISNYPVIFFMNLHTGTPFPTSDVRLTRGLQEYVNKIRSLIIAHATTATNIKVLLPEGLVDREEFEEQWAKPNAVVTFDASEGQPVIATPPPLPNELYHNEQQARSDIERQLGLYELMLGNSQAAPSTYKATISIDEFGQRRIRSKLMDIEGGLKRLAMVMIPLMQQLYTSEKVIRVVAPNNSINEYTINKKLYDDPSGEIKVFNDITVGAYDVAVVSGSTLPSNRYAQLELYMDLYEKGVIDREAVLGKTEVFDKEEIMKRISAVEQLTAQLEQAEEQIKGLRGDMQTKDREIQNLRNRVEVEKFKSDLNKSEVNMRAAATLFEQRLADSLAISKAEESDKKKREQTGTPPSRSKSKK